MNAFLNCCVTPEVMNTLPMAEQYFHQVFYRNSYDEWNSRPNEFLVIVQKSWNFIQSMKKNWKRSHLVHWVQCRKLPQSLIRLSGSGLILDNYLLMVYQKRIHQFKGSPLQRSTNFNRIEYRTRQTKTFGQGQKVRGTHIYLDWINIQIQDRPGWIGCDLYPYRIEFSRQTEPVGKVDILREKWDTVFL